MQAWQCPAGRGAVTGAPAFRTHICPFADTTCCVPRGSTAPQQQHLLWPSCRPPPLLVTGSSARVSMADPEPPRRAPRGPFIMPDGRPLTAVLEQQQQLTRRGGSASHKARPGRVKEPKEGWSKAMPRAATAATAAAGAGSSVQSEAEAAELYALSRVGQRKQVCEWGGNPAVPAAAVCEKVLGVECEGLCLDPYSHSRGTRHFMAGRPVAGRPVACHAVGPILPR